MGLEAKINKIYKAFSDKQFSPGCIFLTGSKQFPINNILNKYMSYIECGCRNGSVAGSSITGWDCSSRGCKNKGISSSTSTPNICNTCSLKKDSCQFCLKYLEIIGHPIYINRLEYILDNLDYLNVRKSISRDELLLKIEEWNENSINIIYKLLDDKKYS